MRPDWLQRLLDGLEEEPVGWILMALVGLFMFGGVCLIGAICAAWVWYLRPWSFVLLPVLGLLLGRYGDGGDRL